MTNIEINYNKWLEIKKNINYSNYDSCIVSPEFLSLISESKHKIINDNKFRLYFNHSSKDIDFFVDYYLPTNKVIFLNKLDIVNGIK